MSALASWVYASEIHATALQVAEELGRTDSFSREMLMAEVEGEISLGESTVAPRRVLDDLDDVLIEAGVENGMPRVRAMLRNIMLSEPIADEDCEGADFE